MKADAKPWIVSWIFNNQNFTEDFKYISEAQKRMAVLLDRGMKPSLHHKTDND